MSIEKISTQLFLSALILVGLMMMPSGAFSETPATTTAPDALVHHRHGHYGEFKKIHKALHDLDHAKKALEHATSDLDGHKANALSAINQAEQELNAALESAKQAKPAAVVASPAPAK